GRGGLRRSDRHWLGTSDGRTLVAAGLRAGGCRSGKWLTCDLPHGGPCSRCAGRSRDRDDRRDWVCGIAGRAARTWLCWKTCRAHIDLDLRDGAVLCDGPQLTAGTWIGCAGALAGPTAASPPSTGSAASSFPIAMARAGDRAVALPGQHHDGHAQTYGTLRAHLLAG